MRNASSRIMMISMQSERLQNFLRTVKQARGNQREIHVRDEVQPLTRNDGRWGMPPCGEGQDVDQVEVGEVHGVATIAGGQAVLRRQGRPRA